jgi:choline dehydrogenase-like flavoprotein
MCGSRGPRQAAPPAEHSADALLPRQLTADSGLVHAEGPYHGKGGLLSVENPRYHHRLHDVFFQAAQQHGIPANTDFNDWSRDQVRARAGGRGSRGSSSTTCSPPAMRPGLVWRVDPCVGTLLLHKTLPAGYMWACVCSLPGCTHLPAAPSLARRRWRPGMPNKLTMRCCCVRCAQAGFGEFQVTQDRGERGDAHRQYLAPAMGRPNLQARTQPHPTPRPFHPLLLCSLLPQ